jgi:hypothetical protein
MLYHDTQFGDFITNPTPLIPNNEFYRSSLAELHRLLLDSVAFPASLL